MCRLACLSPFSYAGAMFGFGVGELLIVLVIILVVFGAGRLPEVMGSLGKGIQSFKRGLREPPEIDVTPEQDDESEGGAGH